MLASKLMSSGHLVDPEDIGRLDPLIRNPVETAAREDIISRGDLPEKVHLVLGGLACRYKVTEDGRRAIVALLLPGDFCDLHVSILKWMDHSISTLTACTLVHIPRTELEEMLESHPRIARAMWWATLVDEAILREWLVNMGKRRSDRQMAHLFCELSMRLAAVTGIGGSLPLLTQEQIGDVLGITHVHANRVLLKLRNDGYISVQGRRIVVEDFDALATFAEFTPDYLHLPGV